MSPLTVAWFQYRVLDGDASPSTVVYVLIHAVRVWQALGCSINQLDALRTRG